MPKFSFYHQTKARNMWADSSVWYECLTCTQEAAGSIPARSTTNNSNLITYAHVNIFHESVQRRSFLKKTIFQQCTAIRILIGSKYEA